MKTQINNIINGCKDVRIDETNEKYISAVRSTSHSGFAGTSRNICNGYFNKVLNENGESLKVSLFGKEIEMKLGKSLSGKTVWYEASITEEDFVLFSGSRLGLKTTKENTPSLELDSECKLAVKNGMYYQYIGTEFITIQ